MKRPAQKRIRSYHFDIGNSTTGPIGMAGRIVADSQEAVLRILAVTPRDRSPGECVDATRTWERISALRAAGYSKAETSRLVGHRSRGLQYPKTLVHRRSARAVAALFMRLWLEDPVVRATVSEELLPASFRPHATDGGAP